MSDYETIGHIPDTYKLLVNVQDTEPIHKFLGKAAQPFGGFFVIMDGLSYLSIYGYKGYTPTPNKPVTKLL